MTVADLAAVHQPRRSEVQQSGHRGAPSHHWLEYPAAVERNRSVSRAVQ